MVLTLGTPKMTYELSSPDGTCVRAYFCRDSWVVLMKTFSEWWMFFGRNEELEEEVRARAT